MMKNRLFRNTCMLAALSVAAASCADDEFAKGGKLSDGAIGFGTSAVTAGDGSPLSRAVHYGDTPLVLLDKSGAPVVGKREEMLPRINENRNVCSVIEGENANG